jgi:hypothetical protein
MPETVEWGALGCCRLGRVMMGPAKETQPREREHEDQHEQKEEHMKSHKILVAWNWDKGSFLNKEASIESKGLSSGWERRLNYPPPKEAVPS